MDNYDKKAGDGYRHVSDDGGTQSGVPGFFGRLAGRTEDALSKGLGGSGKVSWGLVVLGLAAIYAAFNLVRGFLYFF